MRASHHVTLLDAVAAVIIIESSSSCLGIMDPDNAIFSDFHPEVRVCVFVCVCVCACVCVKYKYWGKARSGRLLGASWIQSVVILLFAALCLCVCARLCMRLCVYVCTHAYARVCAHVYVQMCLLVCICVYVRMRIGVCAGFSQPAVDFAFYRLASLPLSCLSVGGGKISTTGCRI